MKLNSTKVYETAYEIDVIIDINTRHSSLLLGVNTINGELLQLFFGEKCRSSSPKVPRGVVKPGSELYAAYSAFGGAETDVALRATHADGALSTELVYDSHLVEEEDSNRTLTTIKLVDKHYAFSVLLSYRAFFDENVIECWVSITHEENEPVILHQCPSVELTFVETSNDYFLTSLHGLWERENELQEERLYRGKKVLENRYGTWSSFGSNPSFMLSLGQPSTEDSGPVVAGALAWSGAWKMTFNHDAGRLFYDKADRRRLNVTIGASEFAAEYHLAPGEQFSTPAFIFTFSSNGRGTASRNLHRWSRKYCLREGGDARPVVLNSWEGAGFDFDESKLLLMMDQFASMGGEMFVLDDGWFGNKNYARNNPSAGLGDWNANRTKIPNGLSSLVNEAKTRGLRFGIWIEPEMVNPNSLLFEAHPEWAIQQPDRENVLYRDQLVLDLCNPKVEAFVYQSVAAILSDNSEIAYVKWDCNRSITNLGSTYLGFDRQTHVWYEYVKSLYRILDRLAVTFPNVMIQMCASGGGRIDFGALGRSHEFWASDNTDALQRIYIQWGTNYIYPAIATGAHVTHCPNKQTGRTTPLKFRFDVAMTGRLGLELDPSVLPERDNVYVKAAIEEYKRIRPVVAFGDLYRLVSPYGNDYCALMYVSDDKCRALVFAYNLGHRLQHEHEKLILAGLDAQQRYRISEINYRDDKRAIDFDGEIVAGSDLMSVGISVDVRNEFDSIVLELHSI